MRPRRWGIAPSVKQAVRTCCRAASATARAVCATSAPTRLLGAVTGLCLFRSMGMDFMPFQC